MNGKENVYTYSRGVYQSLTLSYYSQVMAEYKPLDRAVQSF